MIRTATRSPVPLVLVAVVLLVAVAALGASFRFGDAGPLAIDEWWQGVTTISRGSAAFAVAVFFAEIGSAMGAMALGALAAALLFVKRRPRDAATVATALVLGVLGSELIKALVLRPRPGGALYPTYGSSYPSGHSMGAAALAISVALVFAQADRVSIRTRRLIWGGAVAWIALMMWSRAALHAHWLSDTIAGAALGTAVALIARALWMRADPPLRSAQR